MHALVAVNGEKLEASLLKKLAKTASLIAAADGGAAQLLCAGIMPHAVIGDLDSLPANLRRKAAAVLVHVKTQQNNDLEKTLSYLAKKGATSCTLVGLAGGRLDFTLGNLLLLKRFAKKMQLEVVGENYHFYLLCEGRSFTCVKGARASLLPLTRCSGVSLEGFVYPLKNASLNVGTTRTLSNQTKAPRVRVALQKGILGFYLETSRQK